MVRAFGVDWREVDGKGFGTKLYMEKWLRTKRRASGC